MVQVPKRFWKVKIVNSASFSYLYQKCFIMKVHLVSNRVTLDIKEVSLVFISSPLTIFTAILTTMLVQGANFLR
jgi:DNA/RNA endonuclease G (NUC1)